MKTCQKHGQIPHFLRAKERITSESLLSLFCKEHQERFAHGCSLKRVIFNERANSKRAISERVNSERANSQPLSLCNRNSRCRYKNNFAEGSLSRFDYGILTPPFSGILRSYQTGPFFESFMFIIKRNCCLIFKVASNMNALFLRKTQLKIY